jgi:heat shock protein HslJ
MEPGMKSKTLVFFFLVGLCTIGVADGASWAIAHEKQQEKQQEEQEIRYNCLTREVWSPEKRAWCAIHHPFNAAGDRPQSLLDRLADTEWQLEDLAGQDIVGDTPITIIFDGTESIRGQGGCNGYFAEVDWEGDRPVTDDIIWTMRLCQPDVMEQETTIHQALSHLERLELVGERLILHIDTLEQPLTFLRLHI